MIGLLHKDLLLLRKSLMTYGLFLVLYLGLSVAGVFPLSVASAALEVCLLMLPLSAFAYDDQARWDRYAMALPLSPAQVVGGRYLLVLLLVAAAMVGSGLICAVAGALRLSAAETAASALVTTGLVLLIQDLCLPLCYKLGLERARTAFYCLMFLPLFGSIAAGKLGWVDFSLLNALSAPQILLLCSLPLLLGLAGLWVSYRFSCRIAAAKEY